MAPGSMLDVGAAAGFLMDGFRSFHWQCTGLEPNRNLAERAQQEGYTMHVATLEEFASPEKFQLICMVQVIAHLYDVPRALRNAARHTADQGYWLIETWNYRSLTARFFGRHWHEYSPPSVLHWFSPKSLARLASQFQMVPVARGRPRKLLNGAHAKSLLRYRLQRTAIGRAVAPCIRLLPDRLTIPYPCEDLFWLLLRRQ
jgi:SAM-dependent methyltransferase